MKRIALAAFLVLACSRNPPLPLDTRLWHLGEWRAVSPGVRTTTAAVISFRSTGEFIDQVCHVIEQPDGTVYFKSDAKHVVLIGKWTKQGDEVVVVPTIVYRGGPSGAAHDPLCDQPPLRFKISGNSLTASDGQYSIVTRLVAPDFESYIDEAKRKGVNCQPPPPPK